LNDTFFFSAPQLKRGPLGGAYDTHMTNHLFIRASLVAVSACAMLAARASAQDCGPIAVDSVLASDGPVFQACGVDKAAQRKGARPIVRYELPSGQHCVAAVVEFIVNVDGNVSSGSVRVVRTSDETFARQVVRRIERARYSPAQKGGVPVRQVVRDTLSIREVAYVPGASPAPGNMEPPCL
jgi:hypothetical protein